MKNLKLIIGVSVVAIMIILAVVVMPSFALSEHLDDTQAATDATTLAEEDDTQLPAGHPPPAICVSSANPSPTTVANCTFG